MNLNTILEEINHLKIMLEYNDSNSFELTTKTKQAKKAEMQSKVKEINNKLIEFNNKLENILKEVNQNFDFNYFIDNLKTTSTFDEINPRIEYEKAQEILKYVEEKKEKDRLERERINKENEKYRKEQFIKNLNITNRSLLKQMYYSGPEDTEKLERLIEKGLDVSDSIYPIIRLIERGRTLGFIQFLIKNGLKLNQNDIVSLKNKNFFDSKDFLKTVYDAKQIDNKIVNETLKQNE